MKRRSFLAMLGLAPVAAVAQPKQSSVRIPANKLDPDAVIEFKDGKLSLSTVNIGKVTAGTIRTEDASFSIDLSAGRLVWR